MEALLRDSRALGFTIQRNTEGMTPIEVAATKGKRDVFILLRNFMRPCDIFSILNDGANGGRMNWVKDILKMDYESQLPEGVADERRSRQPRSTALLRAAQTGVVEDFNVLLEEHRRTAGMEVSLL